MKELLISVGILTTEELARSYEKFPKFNSPHEGYAVIKEEIDETINEIEFLKCDDACFWTCVKQDDFPAQCANVKQIKFRAIHAAAEAIQVAAMAQNYIDSLGGES